MELFSSSAASVGIIGGADGPTAIIVSRVGMPPWIPALCALAILALALVFIFKRKNK